MDAHSPDGNDPDLYNELFSMAQAAGDTPWTIRGRTSPSKAIVYWARDIPVGLRPTEDGIAVDVEDRERATHHFWILSNGDIFRKGTVARPGQVGPVPPVLDRMNDSMILTMREFTEQFPLSPLGRAKIDMRGM